MDSGIVMVSGAERRRLARSSILTGCFQMGGTRDRWTDGFVLQKMIDQQYGEQRHQINNRKTKCFHRNPVVPGF